MSKEVFIYRFDERLPYRKLVSPEFYKWLNKSPVEFFLFHTSSMFQFVRLPARSYDLNKQFTHADRVIYKFEIEDPKDDIIYEFGKPMSPEFYEWLEDCPEKFSLKQTSAAYVTYKFETEDPEDDMMAAEEIKAEKRHNEGLRWPR